VEFHISRTARDHYQFDESLFSISGNVVLANFLAARVLAQKMNAKRDLARFPEQAIKAGELNAMGLIDEILHLIAAAYRQDVNPTALEQAVAWLENKLGVAAVDRALRQFVNEFPPLAVYQGKMNAESYLAGETDGIPNRQLTLEEMLMLWLANMNPAFSPFMELFDDTTLEKETAYLQIIYNLREFFETQPRYGPQQQNLVDVLRSPALANPYSLTGQLEFLRQTWSRLLGPLLLHLLTSLDLIKEEQRMDFAGPGPAPVLEFPEIGLGLPGLPEAEPERYSPDLEWMPRLVMIAKNTYVWLDQLSKKYQRPITRLDQIPDAELDTLARWRFTGLWLIGLWERSRASQRIKQLTGNPEAIASAYSLFDYQIAADLGGEEAFQNLRERAWQRGIRLASDMVPNHMGIDSRWVIEHPDWFIHLDYSPFPTYTFTGPDLSWDERVGIFLEDHYYTRTDAAVVFKRVDRWTGQEMYIYHGNDGTRMPWNDTAQLNFLKPEVREAVIQTIVHVARKFPIIRFDAAMTLTKRHYQRLWFPEPGTGGAIPSRAGHGLTKAQFDALIPEEFWREVVDRMAQEAPETLLLAEAFWLMEGYFVRTLGMHRVYNSAFMNMLKNEENEKYRSSLKNVLAFDPEILKRFVNFMSNPDEETAVAQFGKEDKYFGVCTLMVTLPGLPMFGHGQIEGFTEKYGMEYRRAYWDEQPDENLIHRHEREIFPLMRRRHLFAEVQNFLLYDLVTPEGYVNENVIAYSNRVGQECALVVYHNKFDTAGGWLHTSVPYRVKTTADGSLTTDPTEGEQAPGTRALAQKTLGEGLGLHPDENYFCIFRDHVSGLEYIRNSYELFHRGLYVELAAFKYQVFLDFREVEDTPQQPYARLAASLGGRGVPSIDEALKDILLQPIHQPFKALVNATFFRRLIEARLRPTEDRRVWSEPHEVRCPPRIDHALLDEVEQKIIKLLQAIKPFTGATGDEMALAQEMRRELTAILQLPGLDSRFPMPGWAQALPAYRKFKSATRYLRLGLNLAPEMPDGRCIWGSLLSWSLVHSLGKIVGEDGFEPQSRSWLDEWRLGKIIAGTLQELGIEASAASQAVTMIKLLTRFPHGFATWVSSGEPVHSILQTHLQDDEVRQFLKVNRFNEIWWFNKEAFGQWLWWMFLMAVVHSTVEPHRQPAIVVQAITAQFDLTQTLHRAERQSEYQIEKLLAGVM